MSDLCTSCLCAGRNLQFIDDAGYSYFYTQILNEICTYAPPFVVRVCWECRATLQRLQRFKATAQASYQALLQHSQQNTSPPPHPPRLSATPPATTSFPTDGDVKLEPNDVNAGVMLTSIDVKEEEHCEPVTFVRRFKTPKEKKKKHKTKAKFKKKHREINIDLETSNFDHKHSYSDYDDEKDRLDDVFDDDDDESFKDEQKDRLKDEDLSITSNSLHTDSIEGKNKSEKGTKGRFFEEDGSFKTKDSIKVKSKSEKRKTRKTKSLKSDTALSSETYKLNLKNKDSQVYKNSSESNIDLQKDDLMQDNSEYKDSSHSKDFKDKDNSQEQAGSDYKLGSDEYKADVDYSEANIEDGDGLKCYKCDEVFEDKVIFDWHYENEHVKTSSGKKPRQPRSKESLPDRPTCEDCGKHFSSRKTYRYHINTLHKGQNRYPCPRCGRVYRWKSNLGRHLRTHKAIDSGELYCSECDKKFASVATYRQHLKISKRHVPESDFNFMCNECGKKFVSKTRLRDHIDWEHLNKIKFTCQLCCKPFKCHTSLYVHKQNVHRNKEKKDNLCHVCGKSYQNAAKLKYHIVALHSSQTPYRCAHCAAAFSWHSSLYRHVREVHFKMKMPAKKSKKMKKQDLSETMTSHMPLPLPTHQ